MLLISRPVLHWAVFLFCLELKKLKKLGFALFSRFQD